MHYEVSVSEGLLARVSRLDEFRGRWASGRGIPAQRRDRLEEAARIQSVAASCRLSGIRVSDADVAGLLNGTSPPLADAGQILGYSAALQHPTPGSQEILTSDWLREINAIILGGPAAAAAPSPWRDKSHQREAFSADGRATGRVFSTLPPRMIEPKVEELLTWLEMELRSSERHPVLAIGVFVLGFLAASPFETGSARTARLLIGRLLERSGYDHMGFASVESQIEVLREAYHEAFDRTQTGFWTGEGDLAPWLEFFVEVLDRHRGRVETKAELERSVTDYPPLQQAILDTVREHGSVNAALLLKATNANRNTLKDNLRRLVDRGVLEKIGQRRGTHYRLATIDR